jgi:putative membrane protein
LKQIILFFKGLIIGFANVIPGVSGGTMAYIMGIYEQLTGAIGDFLIKKEDRIKNLVFLIIVGFGAVTGIILFARFFSIMLSAQDLKLYTYFFFVGLIVGSIPFIVRMQKDMRPKPARVALLLFAMTAIIALSFTGGQSALTQTPEVKDTWLGMLKITDIDFGYAIWLFACGLMAAGSMVLPGFSGSALLISLGEYQNILYFVDQRMILQIGVVALGAVPGIIFFAKIINIMLKKYPSATNYFILGLVLASIYQVALELREVADSSWNIILFCIISLVVGFVMSYFLSKISVKK